MFEIHDLDFHLLEMNNKAVMLKTYFFYISNVCYNNYFILLIYLKVITWYIEFLCVLIGNSFDLSLSLSIAPSTPYEALASKVSPVPKGFLRLREAFYNNIYKW